MKHRFTVKLDADDILKLQKLAQKELRDFREQAAWIIIKYLSNELLWADDDKGPGVEWTE